MNTAYNDRGQKCCSRETIRKCCSAFTVFFLTHVVLTTMVIGYSLLGGWMFMELEAPEEIRQKAVVGKIRSKYVEELWELTMETNVLLESAWINAADEKLRAFQTDIYSAVKEDGWDGTESGDDIQWTFTGALLYSVTTITTIGYGHITPKTVWGRVATIIYALIGIPLTLLCLANIGGSMSECFKFFYSTILCKLCHPRRRRERRSRRGDNLEQTEKGIRSDNSDSVDPSVNRMSEKRSRRCGCCKGDNSEEIHLGPTSGHHDKLEPVAEICKPEPNENSVKILTPPKEIIRVPVIVTVTIMAGYIFLGALMFTLWEKDWDYLIGAYFCFVTLSTIGFGDVVPGSSLQSWSSQQKQIMCSLYLLFGLALLSMCFDLMQEQVRHTCRRAGMCLGIVRKKES